MVTKQQMIELEMKLSNFVALPELRQTVSFTPHNTVQDNLARITP